MNSILEQIDPYTIIGNVIPHQNPDIVSHFNGTLRDFYEIAIVIAMALDNNDTSWLSHFEKHV